MSHTRGPISTRMTPLPAACPSSRCGPPFSPIGYRAWTFGFISRTPAFSGRPIREPTLQGAESSHRNPESRLTSHSERSTPCSSSRTCAARRAVVSAGPESSISLAAAFPAASVSCIPSPSCLAAVSAFILTTARRPPRSSWRAPSCAMIAVASRILLTLSSMCDSASVVIRRELPWTSSPSPSTSPSQ